MSHAETWELLLAEYVEGTLPPATRRRLERHLAGCESCRSSIAVARAGQAALLGLADEPAGGSDADFLAAVERRALRSAPPVVVSRAGFAARLAAFAGDPAQVRPAFWFLLSLPVFGLINSPGLGALALAASGLLLGALLEYASMWEASARDSH